ncbi:hypothetical protein D049_3213B, partial [Vibrio parahaemolyticus VPTS-2010]
QTLHHPNEPNGHQVQ